MTSEEALPLGRAPQEIPLAGLIGERHRTPAPELDGLTRHERHRALTAWTDQLQSGRPEGPAVLHHTGQTAEEVARRYRRMEARSARMSLKTAEAAERAIELN